MAADYPGSIKSFTTKTDGVDDVEAAHINDMQLEITAIETELGINPAGQYAKYTTNAGQSIPDTTATIINYEDVETDPNSLVTVGASWKFTAPATGVYLVIASMLFDGAAWAANDTARLRVSKNTATYAILDYKFIEANITMNLHLHGEMTAGFQLR